MPEIVLKAGSRPPWVGLAAAIWVQTCAGNAYTFPLYSNALKSILGFNQEQVTMLGVANDFGESFGLLPGIACNKLPPWALLAMGASFCFLGYGVIYLSVAQLVPAIPYWLLWIALVVASNSNAWFGTAVLVTNMRNFPLSRGTVSGIVKGYVGLAASVYTVLFNGVLGESSTHLLLFLSLGLPIVCFSMMYFIKPCTPAYEEDDRHHHHFLFTQTLSVLLGVYLLVATVISDIVGFSNAVSTAVLAAMLLFMLYPIAIPLKMTLFPSKKPFDPSLGASSSTPLLTPSSSGFIDGGELSDTETLLAVGEGAIKKKRRPRRGEDFRCSEALEKADFWLLWLVYFCGVGSGVTVLNNLAQIGNAFGTSDTTLLLSLFGFCNFIGRLGSGAVSEYFVRSRMIPRTVWMMLAQVVMVGCFVPFAYGLNGVLYVATPFLGLAYGTLYNSMVPIASELFGLKHFGVIYNSLLLGNPIGALLFSGILAGGVYDAAAGKQGSSYCVGVECFKMTFLVLSGVCALGSVLGVVLTVRVWSVYRMLYSGGSFRIPQGH